MSATILPFKRPGLPAYSKTPTDGPSAVDSLASARAMLKLADSLEQRAVGLRSEAGRLALTVFVARGGKID